MQLIYDDKKTKYYKDKIVFLLIIDADLTDMSCILSTITFLSKLAEMHKKPAIITFDQPLFWKGSHVITQSNDSTIKGIHLTSWNISCRYEFTWLHWPSHGREWNK